MDLLTVTEELRTIEYGPDGSVTFRFSTGDIGARSDDDIIEFCNSNFSQINLILRCLLILNYYQNAEVEKSAVAVNITADSWVTKNGPT